MTKIAIFPGSFDPYTKGHHDIVVRGLEIFDKVVIGVGRNTSKKRHFDIDLILGKISETYSNNSRIEVTEFDELTADLAKRYNAKFLLRGLRNTTDFEYENSISQINKHLNQTLETVFLITSPNYAYISSTIIREVHKYGGDINAYLPYSL